MKTVIFSGTEAAGCQAGVKLLAPENGWNGIHVQGVLFGDFLLFEVGGTCWPTIRVEPVARGCFVR